jgi:probable 2-oxoglutarate dehydrogenase E1 component DHKTD1
LKSNAVKEVVFDMQHRGRLNILPFLFDYPFSQMFHKMSGKRDIPANIEAIDDVISHISTSNKKLFYSKGNINDYEEIVVTMVHNPSHLEAVCPVSMGKSLAKIDDYDGKSELVLNIHIHGDAALAGQGVNYEMMNLNKTPGGDIGGSIHIVSNNQIGYTTDPHLSRSTPYW